VRAQVALGARLTVAAPPEGRLWSELPTGVARVPIARGWSLSTPLRLGWVGADLHVAHTSHAHGCAAVLATPLVVHRMVDVPPRPGWKYRRPEGYVALSEAIAARLRAAGARRVAVIPGAIEPVPAVPPAADGPTVLAVGARVAHKGHDVLAAAAQLLPGVDIGVAGEGPLRPPGLRLLGQREDIPALLAAARVFVMPSRSEGQGLAALEALSAGVPVVASAVGGLVEVVGEHGILVDPGDPAALARGIARALGGDHPDLAAGRAWAARSSPERAALAHLSLYRAVLG
jgi:glycosyltransferase involved in cell wall biosynthesis